MSLPGFFQGTGMPDPDWWEALWPDPAGVLDRLGMMRGMSVVDLCCGDAWFTLPIARIAHDVVAIDIDAQLIAMARKRLEDAAIHNCRFVAGDAFEIGRLIAAPADFVFLANVFHGVPDRPRLARAVRDSLKERGLFAILSWHARPREETTVLGAPRGPASELRMTPAATIAAVEPSGFELTTLIDISPYHYGAVFQRR